MFELLPVSAAFQVKDDVRIDIVADSPLPPSATLRLTHLGLVIAEAEPLWVNRCPLALWKRVDTAFCCVMGTRYLPPPLFRFLTILVSDFATVSLPAMPPIRMSRP